MNFKAIASFGFVAAAMHAGAVMVVGDENTTTVVTPTNIVITATWSGHASSVRLQRCIMSAKMKSGSGGNVRSLPPRSSLPVYTGVARRIRVC